MTDEDKAKAMERDLAAEAGCAHTASGETRERMEIIGDALTTPAERYAAMTEALWPDWEQRESMPAEECIRLLIGERDRYRRALENVEAIVSASHSKGREAHVCLLVRVALGGSE